MIHKRYNHEFEFTLNGKWFVWVMCKINAELYNTSIQWKNVTCKKCLRLKP